jgi:hypothetical protein
MGRVYGLIEATAVYSLAIFKYGGIPKVENNTR